MKPKGIALAGALFALHCLVFFFWTIHAHGAEGRIVFQTGSGSELSHENGASLVGPAEIVEAIRAGDVFVVELEGEPLTGVIDRASVNRIGTAGIRGRLADYPLGHVFISVSGTRSAGFIRIPERNVEYRISYDLETGGFYCREIDASEIDAIPPGDPLLPRKKEDPDFMPDGEALKGFRTTPHSGAMVYEDGDLEAVIDIMVVYTPAARNWAAGEGGIENVIALAIDKLQLALENSDTRTTVELVHAAEIQYQESGKSGEDLELLQSAEDGMDVVHEWRNRYGADLVAILANVNDMGGIAYQLERASGNPEYAFSLTRVQQAATSYTFAHEIGHNLGLGHHKEQLPDSEPPGGLFSYSAGWRWVGNDGSLYSTIMTYPQREYFADGMASTNVPYFSNPQIYFMNKPTGDALDGDNARTLRQVRHVVAAYREGGSENPGILNFSVSPDEIEKGESAVLKWVVVNADNVYISSDPGTDIGFVAKTGEREVEPEKDTTYTLTATNPNGADEQSVTIQVFPASADREGFPLSGGGGGGCFIDALGAAYHSP